MRSYLTSILTRDLRDIAEVEKLTELPKFVRLLAEHSGQLVNYSQFGGGINVSHKTGQRYVGLLEQVFLIATVQPWFTNSLKRIVKTPKLHFLDSGLLATMRGLTFDRVKADRGTFGALLESFVFSEVLKLMTASDLRLTPHHFRDRDMREVDIVLERDDGTIVGIEVKASATVKASDFAGLRALAEACGDRFAFGVVLYDSTDVVPFGDRLAAAPLSCLWGASAMKAFEFDHRLIDSYARFSRSFSTIRSDDLKSEIDRQYDAGRFWPDALLSLNPRYLQGATVDDLVDLGDLDEATGHIFRFGATPIRFHRHQAQSIAKARTGQSYVVTTGTGSGKSLCFFVPIVDAIVRARKAGRARKTSAIIVYPMNALANSQMNEIDKFISQSGLPSDLKPIVRRYTGQESQEERRRIADDPPDILLTNFMMARTTTHAPRQSRHQGHRERNRSELYRSRRAAYLSRPPRR